MADFYHCLHQNSSDECMNKEKFSTEIGFCVGDLEGSINGVKKS